MMMVMVMVVLILILSLSSLVASHHTTVDFLPGYPLPLPFKLQTGYIGVGEEEAVQLFYYFIESEGNPHEDPLIIWLAGGPGCSPLLAFTFEIGPFRFMDGKYIDNVPALRLDPNRWTKVANIIYVDAPTSTGFSYTTTQEAVVTSDTLSASNTAEFIRKFVRDHPRFLKNPLYVAGISYSGIVIPLVTENIYKGNDDGLKPMLNIKGYIMENPLTDKTGDINARLEFVHRMALIPDELYESTRKNCNGEYANADSDNYMCMESIAEVNNRIKRINIEQILDPSTYSDTNFVRSRNPNYQPLNPIKMVPGKASLQNIPSRDPYGYYYQSIWANDVNVRRALNVREGKVKEWVSCNKKMAYYYGQSSPEYNSNIHSNVVYHKKLSTRNCRALVMSGDHDIRVSYIGTLKWISSLNLTMLSNWDAWYVDDQVAGYKNTYKRDNYSLVFATVKGSGHEASQWKPQECFEMVKRWLAYMVI